MVADPHHFNADPEPRIRITLMLIRSLLIKAYKWWESATTGLHYSTFEPPGPSL
jgi:hypothetical protein